MAVAHILIYDDMYPNGSPLPGDNSYTRSFISFTFGPSLISSAATMRPWRLVYVATFGLSRVYVVANAIKLQSLMFELIWMSVL